MKLSASLGPQLLSLVRRDLERAPLRSTSLISALSGSLI